METKCIEHGRNDCREGYARVMRKGVRKPIHHWVLLDAGHTIPDNSVVMHLCNNPRCINLNHLKIGSQSENILQMYKEGRGVNNKGEKNGQAKLTDVQAQEIRIKRSAGETLEALSKEYNVSPSLISAIAYGKRRASL